MSSASQPPLQRSRQTVSTAKPNQTKTLFKPTSELLVKRTHLRDCGMWFQNLKPPTFQEAISPSLSKLNFYKNIQKKLKMGCVWCFWCFALTVKCYSEWFLFVCKVILKRHFWLHDLKHNLNYNKNLIIFATYLEKHLLLPSSLLQSFSEFPGTICQNLAFFIKMCFF